MIKTITSYFGTGYDDVGHNLFGTEYEVESIYSYDNVNAYVNGIIIEHDHSLRNNGFEFKTKAIDLEESLNSFTALFKYLVFKKENEAFSERTSTHVHVNVGDLSLEQAKEFVLLYALLEPVFFSFVDASRQNNIFCVPLNFTALTKYYHLPFEQLVKHWHKYTAFNIIPAKEFGTFEFRHLEGTKDFDKYKNWISAIDSLKSFAMKGEVTALQYLEQGRSIKELARVVIPSICPSLLTEDMFYHTALDVKLSKREFL